METIRTAAQVQTPDAGRIVQSITLDLAGGGGISPQIKLVQYDTKLPIVAVHLKNGQQPYALPDGAAANVRMTKTDGKGVYNPAYGISADRHTAYVEISAQMTACAGLQLAVLEIVTGDMIKNTQPFALAVTANPLAKETYVSKDEYNTISQYVGQAEAAKKAAEQAAAAAGNSAAAADKRATDAEAAKQAAAQSAAASDKRATDAEEAKQATAQSAAAADKRATDAEEAKQAAAQSAAAADKRATDAENAAKAAATATANSFFGVEFTGSTSAGVRTGAAADFVFTPGTDTDAGANSFDAVYPWAGMRRCCCTLNADGTVLVNAYKGQPGYIEDGTNGEVLVEVPLFYIAGAIDVDPRISNMKMPGYRVPKKFLNHDGSVKQRCYVRAFPGSIGEDGKLHSVAGAIPSMGKTIQQNLDAARLWGDKYSIGTSADAELLMYLMVVAYGTRNAQAKVMGVTNLYEKDIAVAAETTDEAAVICAKGALEVGNIISVGTGGENSSVALYRMVTAVEAIAGDTANVKCSVSGAAFTATTAHKIWRIINGTGTANSVIASCGSPVSNTDGRHSFVFYGVENPLYGNQWRTEADWKVVDGVPYICNDTNYQWSSLDGYTKLNTEFPATVGYVKNLATDERYPHLPLPKEVGASATTYCADYFWINRNGTRIARRGGSSDDGRSAGPFSIYLSNPTGTAWWYVGANLSIPG